VNPVAGTGAVIVVLALVVYSVGVVAEQRGHLVTRLVLRMLAGGVILDITATMLMGLASSKGPFTLHGLLGYTSLAGMLAATWRLWRFAAAHSADTRVPRGLHLFVRAAYLWWVAAFITGVLLAVRR